jgi:hypothetical protein
LGEAVLSGWGDFAVVMGAATAALLGLLFVAVSIRVETIAKSAKQRNRSAQTLTLLLTGLLVAALLAVPDQSKWALGAEFLALALVVSGVALILDRRADGQSGSAIGRRLDAINPTFITCSLLVIADDDVEDVIALMRLNYERVVERHALPAVGSRGL